MKNSCFVISFCVLIFSLSAKSQWTWVSGDNVISQKSVYGLKDVPSINNTPGSRLRSASWTDDNGYFWLYGGDGGYGDNTNYLSDLWRFNFASSEWTWVNGDSTPLQMAVYGTKGIPSITNKPGGKRWANSWVDRNGMLWLFGGTNFQAISPTVSTTYSSNSIWKYNPLTNEWTWVSGDSTMTSGVYGIRGIASPTNKPGGREAAISWTDANGDFWLFGGFGFGNSNAFGRLNDLWKYNPSTNVWSWISGDSVIDQQGIYGNKGVPSLGNRPGSRQLSTSWTDANGNLWLFGGEVSIGSSFNSGFFNDLWKFNPSTNEWTWVSGDSIPYQRAIYGTKGVPANNNNPGSRRESMGLTDANGDFWLFGGLGILPGVQTEFYNDLWKFNLSTNQWTWFSGDSTPYEIGIYGSKGVASTTNKPGARSGSIGGIDKSNNLWLFGGFGYASSRSWGFLNDLWKFNLPLNSISTSLNLQNLCQGTPILIAFTANGTYPSGNAFTAQLSNPSGSFDNPLTIGSTNSFSSGSIQASIPSNIPAASGYRIRVISSDPEIVGRDNGSDLTINAVPNVNIADALALSKGVELNTVYIGYSPASSLVLTGHAAGGTPPYSYSWSNGGSASSTIVNPSSTTDFTLKVTDASYCQQSATKNVKVVDVRCGGKGEKVQICSVVPGNIINPSTSCVSASTVPVLLSLGSYLGNCFTEEGLLTMEVSPNPSYNYFNLSVKSNDRNDKITLNIFNILARRIETRTIMSNQTLQIGASYSPGIYFAQVLQGNQKVQTILIKL